MFTFLGYRPDPYFDNVSPTTAFITIIIILIIVIYELVKSKDGK